MTYAYYEQVISELLPSLGTHDGTVVVTPATGAATVDITEELVVAVNSESHILLYLT